MKTKIVLLVSLFFTFYLGVAQVPQGFNYQAIARDGSGNPIINTALPVRITIQSDSLGGITFWIEEHSAVTTNGFGLFTLILGKGVRKTGSTASTFNDIDWTVTPKFIKSEINSGGWKNMGSSRLWTVPYSMVAGKLEGAVQKLEVVGEDTQSDEALFEVKRKDGETMFAVYNHGVRVYMPLDTNSKARKGGFAVGGFTKTKGTTTFQDYFVVNPDSIRAYIDTNSVKARKGGFAVGGFSKAKAGTLNEEYLRVTRDSTRIYINDKGTKSRKGGFAVGGFDKTKGDNDNFFDIATDATGIINPSQNRILWYPLKNAFLAGRVRIGTPDSIGLNSFATGYESKSRGMYSQAMGYKAIANGDYSTAIGKNAVANKINSFAFGDSSRATNSESYALGRGAVASGYRSFAFGSAGVDSSGKVTDVARAIGDYSFAIGQGSQAMGKGTFVFGLADTAKGEYSVAFGYKTSSNGLGATSAGYKTKSVGYGSTAIGYLTSAEGYGTALGSYTIAGYYSTAMGYDSRATGGTSTAMGCRSISSGAYSTALGREATSSGYSSTALGFYTTAFSGFETVLGCYNTTYTPAFTDWQWSPTDRLFVVGNGTSSSQSKRSDAMVILKNGNIGIGTSTPLRTLHLSSPSVSNELIMEVRDGAADWKKWDFVVNGGTGSTQNLNLRILNDAATASTKDVMIWLSNGNVGVGTTAPAYKLQVGNPGDGSQARANAWNLLSDIRLKSNFAGIVDPMKIISSLQGFYFNWNVGTDKSRQLGLSAQDVEKVLPEIVSKGSDGYLSVEYSKLAPILIEAIKVQQQQIETQQKELDELKALVKALVINQYGQGINN